MTEYSGIAAESASRAKSNRIRTKGKRDKITRLIEILRDVELLMRVNAPLNCGSPMHRTIQSILSREEGGSE